MGKSHLPGGLYLGTDGEYHDANGNKVDKKKAEAAVKKTEKAIEETGAPLKAETTPPPGSTPKPTEKPEHQDEVEGDEKRGKLPEDFPKRDVLEAAGINTYGQLRKVDDLTSIEGIGPASAELITEALKS